ncbi:hypothetical protein AVEN_274328-1, partial [Araneus ventricosus]
MVRPPGDESRQLPIAEVKPDSWNHNSPENSAKNDTVTLTKTQFQQILEAIGQSSGYLILLIISNSIPKISEESCNHLQVPCPLDVVISCPASLSWSAPQTTTVSPTKLSPLSRVEQKRLQWEKER